MSDISFSKLLRLAVISIFSIGFLLRFGPVVIYFFTSLRELSVAEARMTFSRDSLDFSSSRYLYNYISPIVDTVGMCGWLLDESFLN